MAKITKSAIRISDNFRENLIIDRNDPVFAMMSASELWHIRWGCLLSAPSSVTRRR